MVKLSKTLDKSESDFLDSKSQKRPSIGDTTRKNNLTFVNTTMGTAGGMTGFCGKNFGRRWSQVHTRGQVRSQLDKTIEGLDRSSDSRFMNKIEKKFCFVVKRKCDVENLPSIRSEKNIGRAEVIGADLTG